MFRLLRVTAIALLVVLGSLGPAWLAAPSGPVSSPRGSEPALPLQQAMRSLTHGAGPAGGVPASCAPSGGSSVYCRLPSPAVPGTTHVVGWQRLCGFDACPPPGRGGAGMTYDPETGYVVLFGGIMNLTTASGTTYNDTWVFQDGNWTPLHISGPTPRLGQYMAYDYADHYVLLFGGGPYLTLNGSLYDSDTWTFQNGTWTQIFPTVSPNARGLGGMVWDAADGYLLMYGGMSGQYDIHSDTWTFVGGQWHNLSLLSHPPPLLSPALAYDPVQGYVLLFGGASPAPGLEFGADQQQTWTYAHGTWTNLTSSIRGAVPDGRILASMAYDPVDGHVVLFGGWNTTTGALFGDTWDFLNGAWTLLFVSPSPAAAIIGASLISTVPTAGLLLFGGIVGSYTSYHSTNATWSFGPAPYLEATPYVVAFTAGPSSCQIEFNGTVQSSGSHVQVLPGAYGAVAVPCQGFRFSGWFTSGGVNVAGVSGPAMTLDVTGNGSLSAYFQPTSSSTLQVEPLTLSGVIVGTASLIALAFWSWRRRLSPARLAAGR